MLGKRCGLSFRPSPGRNRRAFLLLWNQCTGIFDSRSNTKAATASDEDVPEIFACLCRAECQQHAVNIQQAYKRTKRVAEATPRDDEGEDPEQSIDRSSSSQASNTPGHNTLNNRRSWFLRKKFCGAGYDLRQLIAVQEEEEVHASPLSSSSEHSEDQQTHGDGGTDSEAADQEFIREFVNLLEQVLS